MGSELGMELVFIIHVQCYTCMHYYMCTEKPTLLYNCKPCTHTALVFIHLYYVLRFVTLTISTNIITLTHGWEGGETSSSFFKIFVALNFTDKFDHVNGFARGLYRLQVYPAHVIMVKLPSACGVLQVDHIVFIETYTKFTVKC